MLQEEFQISAELLEKEQIYRKKNQQLSNQAKDVLEKVESVVHGKELLSRPMTAPSVPTKVESRAKKPQTATHLRVKSTESQKDAYLGLGDNQQDIGVEATNRFLKAKLHVLQQELSRLVANRQSNDNTLKDLNDKNKQLTEDNLKLTRSQATTVNLYEKQRKLNQELLDKIETLNSDISNLRKENDLIKRNTKSLENELNTKDVKLNRALEEIDKYKKISVENGIDRNESTLIVRKTTDALFLENKKLLKQKQELLQAFKKQAQLIDILKKQKMHLESVKLLEFTEQEFMRVLNLDQ